MANTLYCMKAADGPSLIAALALLADVPHVAVPVALPDSTRAIGREHGLPQPGPFIQIGTAAPLSRVTLMALREAGLWLRAGDGWPELPGYDERVTAMPRS